MRPPANRDMVSSLISGRLSRMDFCDVRASEVTVIFRDRLRFGFQTRDDVAVKLRIRRGGKA